MMIGVVIGMMMMVILVTVMIIRIVMVVVMMIGVIGVMVMMVIAEMVVKGSEVVARVERKERCQE